MESRPTSSRSPASGQPSAASERHRATPRPTTGGWPLATGDWRLAAGGWRLVADSPPPFAPFGPLRFKIPGDWRLATGDWRLKADRPPFAPRPRSVSMPSLTRHHRSPSMDQAADGRRAWAR
ncbi:hypothetical protein EBL85_16185 [Marichromatium sp. AB32]|nr:hypothetical protein EBL85_16185 [Marichromatium sp. AB32]